MRLSEFILLPQEKKNQAVLMQGIMVAKRKSESYFNFLFQLGGFYVELRCGLLSRKVEEYYTFSDLRQLQPYLEEISLGDLLP